MIDPHWQVIDCDPHTWRNLGPFFEPARYIRAGTPDEHALYLLHDRGRMLRAVDTHAGVRRDLGIAEITNPRQTAAELYARGEWQRVHIIDKRHLAEVARRAQVPANRSLHLDAYYHQVYHLLWDGGAGYVTLPAPAGQWHGWRYDTVAAFFGRLPSSSSLALGVFEGPDLYIGLILEVREATIVRVTTFEGLAPTPELPDWSPESLNTLWQALAAQFAPPAGVLLCSRAAFESWLNAPDKWAALQDAQAAGQASFRVQLPEPSTSIR